MSSRQHADKRYLLDPHFTSAIVAARPGGPRRPARLISAGARCDEEPCGASISGGVRIGRMASSQLRTALVTGSSRGLGRVIAKHLAANGLAVAVNALRGDAQIEE